MKKRPDEKRHINSNILPILSIVSLASLCYSNTLQSPFIFDDFSNIVENAGIRDLPSRGDLSGSRYIGFLSFALNYHLGGLDPSGYHFLNTIIHILNGIILYLFMRITFKTPVMREVFRGNTGSSAFIPAAAAIIFTVHPLQIQAVTYIVQRFTSLTTLFYLLALVLFAKARLSSLTRDNSAPSLRSKKPVACFLLSLFSTVLAMKTKEISFTLPFLIVLYDFTFFTPREQRSSFFSRKRFSYLIPYLLTLLIIPLSRIEAVEGADPLGGSKVPFTRYEFMITQCRVMITYLRLLFLPVNQNMDYDYPIYRSFLTPEIFVAFIVLLLLFASALYVYRLRSASKGKLLMGFGIFWFFLTLSIESSIIPLKELIWEHRLYLPSIGFCMIAATVLSYGLSEGKGLLAGKFPVAAMRYCLLAVIAVSLSVLAYQRNFVWTDEERLWRDVISKSPKKSRPYNNLGYVYESQGLIDKAIGHYRKAIRLNPKSVEAYNNLGNAYLSKHWVDKAIEQFQAALRLKPKYPKANNNLGVAYAKKGLLDEAIERFQIAITAKPEYASARSNLGNAYYGKQEFAQAIEQYQIALKLGSNSPRTHYCLARAYYESGMFGEAAKHYQAALKLRPDFPGAQDGLKKALEGK